jgi:DnaB-like helicase N terminal domain/AAA domain
VTVPEVDDRLPPHDIGAEMAILGAVLSWPGAVADVAAALRPQDFYRPGHQLVLEAVLSLHQRDAPADAITVADEMRRRGQLGRIGGAPYLHDLMSSATTVANTGYHIEIVARAARLRLHIERFSRGLQLAYSPDADPSALDELAAQPVGGSATARPRGLAVVDLEPAAEETPLPVLLCGDRLYRGAVHTLSGPPDSGKTTLACWWMLQAVREEGSVLFLDEEGGREIVTEKFQALGAKPGERIGYVQFPSRSWTGADVADLRALLAERKPAVVAWDSSAAFLARAGLDENAAADVTRFYSQVLTMAAREHDAAVLVIDHDTKNAEPSRYARGSGAKLAAVDVAYKIEPIRPFSKTESGTSRLKVVKDRRGWLERAHEVAFLADRAGDVALTVSISAAAEQGTAPEPQMPPARAKLLAALDDVPAAQNQLIDRIQAEHGHGLKRETVSRELNALLSDGLADRLDQGRGKPALWMRNARSDP